MTILTRLNTFLGASDDLLHETLLPLVHLNLVVYSCAFWMQQPALPEKLKMLNATEVEYGTLQSASAIVALLGSTVIGRIVDVYGARTGLILGQGASAIMYITAAYATSMDQLFFMALPAFFQHAMLCCSAAIAALSSNEARAAAIGRLGLSYGIGMSIGSPIGGYLATTFGVQISFFASFWASLLMALVDLAVLPKLKPPKSVSDSKVDGFDMGAVIRVAKVPAVRDLLLVSVSSGLATSAFRAMFALAAVEELDLTSKDLGYLMSFGAFAGLFTNVFVVSYLVGSVGESSALTMALIAQSISFVAMSYVGKNFNLIFAVSVPQAMSSTLFYTLSSSLMTKLVSSQEQGTAVSLSHATRSSTQVLAPLIGGYIMGHYKFSGVSVLASCISFIGALFSIAFRRDSAKGDDYVIVDDQKKEEEKTRIE